MPDVGIEVNAVPPNLSPSRATLPEVTVKAAEPCLPATPAMPGRFLSGDTILVIAGNGIVTVPAIAPCLSHAETVSAPPTRLGFTTETPVLKLVSSQTSVLLVADAPENVTIAS